jgi:hypothetical protein
VLGIAGGGGALGIAGIAVGRGVIGREVLTNCSRRRGGREFSVYGLAAAFGRVSLGSDSGCAAREALDAARNVVKAVMDDGEFIVVIVVIVHAVFRCLLQDDGVQPFAQRHARPARGFPCRLARFRPYAFDTPRHAKFHAHTHIRGGGAKSLDRLSWNRHALTAGGYGRGSQSTHRLFAVRGKQAVNVWPKCRTFPENSLFCGVGGF